MSEDNTNQDAPTPENPEEEGEIIAIACRVQNRDGTKGCGGLEARRVVVPQGPTFYICESCGGRWIPVQVGGTFPY